MPSNSRQEVIISFCQKRKKGLLDHADALKYFGNKLDSERIYLVSKDVFVFSFVLFKHKSLNSKLYVLTWDNSIQSLFVSILARIFGGVNIYYYHEPGGFGQKIFKSDGFFYSLFASFAEYIFCLISKYKLVARPDKICFGDFYCPLLYNADTIASDINSRTMIGFLGAKRNQRLYNLFKSIIPDLNNEGYDVGFFPSNRFGSSKDDKLKFLRNSLFIWNVYGVPYNQSGVTGDCFMNGVPVIFSKFEPFKKLLLNFELGFELDINLPKNELVRNLFMKIDENKKLINRKNSSLLIDAQSKFGGQEAFLQFWKSFFDSIS